jgi:hypothetical protein
MKTTSKPAASAPKPNVKVKNVKKPVPPKKIGSRPDYTHITVILDRSGSMEAIRADTIGGFNAFLAKQKVEPGLATLTLVQFDSQDPYEVIHHFKPIGLVPELDAVTYVPRSCTPLLDAMGRGINDIESCLAKMQEQARPGKVLVVVVTDGQENNSHEFTKPQITKMVDEKSKKDHWQFVFLSSDLAAITDAQTTGIKARSTLAFIKDAQGTQQAWNSLAEATSCCRLSDDADAQFSFNDKDRQRPDDPALQKPAKKKVIRQPKPQP